ncbi:amino acid adenylation domain-containing protein [Streptosporangium becharense]|uniref:Amino acid adenylation domain-containing protein n=1 Tax=Streptosporangium becharense TaxID=1816182 RepID=A0A7W9IB46_9ACTN|nr:non-ribosomal peptide synthetase [Streptosporangium becharense]MBB2914114.1 amino acid adenylation domain-containing protein [Streptosporangium becharense]MBB5817141.1 amino acid adenylation domain-containing protein [Streptosporangium becharense]
MTDELSRIAALSPQKRELLERRLAELATARASAHDDGTGDRIGPRDRSVPTPLGIAQQREWAVERFRGANNITGAFRIEGELDLDLLSLVLTEVVERHEVLRSTFDIDAGGTPVQTVHEAGRVPIPVVDLSGLAPGEQSAELRRRCLAEVSRRFDPKDPLRLRITMFHLAEHTTVALFATDHAASDAWSLSIIVQEVAQLYQARRGLGAAPPAPQIQFGDFAAWQRGRHDEQRISEEVKYWREVMDGVPTGSALQTDRPYPARPTFAGDVVSVHLSPELSTELRRFLEREGASLGTVMLAACSVLLHRHLEQDDLVVGSLVSGRTRVETERLIGCFANPLPLRMRLGPGHTLREVVRQARDTVSDALNHQDVPFDRLIEALGLGREASQTSLSGMWLNVLTIPDTVLELPGLRLTPEPMELGLASVDLTIAVIPKADRLELQWQYMTELFDAGTVELLADQLHAIVRQIVAAPDRPVEAVDLGDPEATADTAATAATAETAGTAAATAAAGIGAAVAPPGPTFVEHFRQRVALAPYSPAVICDGAPTSYAELDREAERLARHLAARGVGKGTRVGILVERSPRLPVAILGTLMAGAAYVPVDPTYPAERIAFMLADAEVGALVTQRSLPADPGWAEQVVYLDEPLDHPPGGTGGELPAPDPSSPAYVIYTSGSTGRPKGTVIEHRSLAVFARDIVDRLGLGSGDRFLQFASAGFDVHVEELFPTWLAGGAVVIPTQHFIGGQADLADLIERERMTVIELPTAYWHEWVRELDRRGRDLPPCLRLVIIGGERVLPERLAMWRRLGVPLMHVYGLTETTVSSTFFRLDPADPDYDWPNLPIGTPLPSAELHILDSRLRPVPRGGTGELYIGGVSVARGYLGRPGLTAQRFVADPARPGRRMYRTGDLIRRRADGTLEFISRVDTQIKIRGFRVEPTEIESTLSEHPAVAGTVVTVHEPSPGDRRLVAYVVRRPEPAASHGDLRRFLEQTLPPYMVPSLFVDIDELPLNHNGKIDRDRLPAPDGGRPELAEEFLAPRTPLEKRLAAIVAAVVAVDEIGVNDNFFEIGGDSILAIQVVARAQEAGIRLEPYDLFANPTVGLLAQVAVAGVVVDAEQGDVTGPVHLVAGQQWFASAGLEDPHHWNTSAVLKLSDRVEPDRVRQAAERLVVHHDGLRQRFLLARERTRVRIAPRGDAVPVDVHDLSGLGEDERVRRMRELTDDMQTGLDLAVGPLLRLALVRSGPERPDRLVLTVHRLTADPASVRILLEDLATLLAGGDLPAKTTSWQSWTRRLSRHAGTPAVQSQRDYWSALLAEPVGRLRYDTAAEAAVPEPGTVSSERTVLATLDAEATGDLARVPHGITAALLTALGRTLSAWTGAERHLVDLERHDREPIFDDVDLTRTVGWFSRIHPVVLDGASAPEAAPLGGIGWQLLHHGSDPLPASPAELLFSYAGPVDQPMNHTASPRGRRPYPVEVRASIVAGGLVVQWCYSEDLHESQTIRDLADRYLAELRELIGAGPAPADFPLARVAPEQLEKLISRLGAPS